MEKVSSLWYHILDEKPLPLFHSKARKRRLQFYQSLHLRLLNKFKVCEPKMYLTLFDIHVNLKHV